MCPAAGARRDRGGGRLSVRVEADDNAGLVRLRTFIDEHLRRFAFATPQRVSSGRGPRRATARRLLGRSIAGNASLTASSASRGRRNNRKIVCFASRRYPVRVSWSRDRRIRPRSEFSRPRRRIAPASSSLWRGRRRPPSSAIVSPGAEPRQSPPRGSMSRPARRSTGPSSWAQRFRHRPGASAACIPDSGRRCR